MVAKQTNASNPLISTVHLVRQAPELLQNSEIMYRSHRPKIIDRVVHAPERTASASMQSRLAILQNGVLPYCDCTKTTIDTEYKTISDNGHWIQQAKVSYREMDAIGDFLYTIDEDEDLRYEQAHPVLMSYTSPQEDNIGVSLVQKWEGIMDRLGLCACFYSESLDEDLVGLDFIEDDE
mmetsp:Transcript_16404/g.39246  ORF Transcript_16404/g.39246 Transcript_16404/m.39246 type:complete len:179 (+) Transcript_16404:130-666(+)